MYAYHATNEWLISPFIAINTLLVLTGHNHLTGIGVLPLLHSLVVLVNNLHIGLVSGLSYNPLIMRTLAANFLGSFMSSSSGLKRRTLRTSLGASDNFFMSEGCKLITLGSLFWPPSHADESKTASPLFVGGKTSSWKNSFYIRKTRVRSGSILVIEGLEPSLLSIRITYSSSRNEEADDFNSVLRELECAHKLDVLNIANSLRQHWHCDLRNVALVVNETMDIRLSVL